MTFHASKDFRDSLRRAIAGNVRAQYEVGRLYYFAIGVQKDRERAKVWLAKCAENRGPTSEKDEEYILLHLLDPNSTAIAFDENYWATPHEVCGLPNPNGVRWS